MAKILAPSVAEARARLDAVSREEAQTKLGFVANLAHICVEEVRYGLAIVGLVHPEVQMEVVEPAEAA